MRLTKILSKDVIYATKTIAKIRKSDEILAKTKSVAESKKNLKSS